MDKSNAFKSVLGPLRRIIRNGPFGPRPYKGRTLGPFVSRLVVIPVLSARGLATPVLEGAKNVTIQTLCKGGIMHLMPQGR